MSNVNTSWAGGFSYIRSGADQQVSSVRKYGTSTTLASVTGRDNLGRITAMNLSGGATMTRAYDALGRLATATSKPTAAATTQTRSWSYDDRGRLETLSRRVGTAPTRTDTYSYMEPGWLTEEVATTGSTSITTSYHYDHDGADAPAGNRTRSTRDGVNVNYTYAYGNELATVDGSSVAWDAYGGVSADHRGYLFDRYPNGEEWAIEAPDTSLLVTIERDVGGRPSKVDDAGSSGFTRQVWDNPGGEWPLAGVDDSGQPLLWVALEGMLIGQSRGSTYKNALSDNRLSLLMFGTQQMDLEGAWGVKANSPTGTSERYVYAGMRLLPGPTGTVGSPFSLAQHRVYDPKLGRFLSMDPMGRAGGDNGFVYANGEPTRFVDPWGLSAAEMGGSRSGFYDEPVESTGHRRSTGLGPSSQVGETPGWVPGKCGWSRLCTDDGEDPSEEASAEVGAEDAVDATTEGAMYVEDLDLWLVRGEHVLVEGSEGVDPEPDESTDDVADGGDDSEEKGDGEAPGGGSEGGGGGGAPALPEGVAPSWFNRSTDSSSSWKRVRARFRPRRFGRYRVPLDTLGSSRESVP